MTKEPMTWIESSGGPLVLLPELLLPSWRGTLPPPHEPISGDYARAVEIKEYLGKIAVGQGEGLVLGGDPLPAAAIPVADGLLVVRWVYAESDMAAEIAIRNARRLPYRPEAFLFDNGDDIVVLMDAAWPGDAVAEVTRLPLRKGTYGVATAEYKPDSDTFFVVHRLERL